MNSNGWTTKQYSAAKFVKPQSVHRRLSVTGSYFGVTPIKLPNGRLVWPPEEVPAGLDWGKKEGTQ